MSDLSILFIGGIGRSGSTLVELLLGRIPRWEATGELRHVWDRGLVDDQLCACGKSFRSCPYWLDVFDAGFGGLDTLDARQAAADMLRITSMRSLYSGWVRGFVSGDVARATARYDQLTRQLLSGIALATGARVIVDSSKHSPQGLTLARVAGSVHQLLLLRDPRAVAYSWTRERPRPEVHWERRLMPQHHVARTAAAWAMANMTCTFTRNRYATHRVLRYEDFVAAPRQTLLDVAKGVEPGVELPSDIFEAGQRQQHSVSGNPMRHNPGPISVRVDDEWKSAMTLGQRLSVQLLTLGVRQAYGY